MRLCVHIGVLFVCAWASVLTVDPLSTEVMRWWFYGPHCCGLIHFFTELVDCNGMVGVERMFCPGTDIDCIDKMLAWEPGLLLLGAFREAPWGPRGQADKKTLTRHVIDSAKQTWCLDIHTQNTCADGFRCVGMCIFSLWILSRFFTFFLRKPHHFQTCFQRQYDTDNSSLQYQWVTRKMASNTKYFFSLNK